MTKNPIKQKKYKPKIEDNLDFYNLVCNDCSHHRVCKFAERIREFDFVKFTKCEHFIKEK